MVIQKEGASLVISSRKQNNVDEAVEKLKAQGVEALGLVCHVSNARQRKNLVDTTVQKYGKIDVVVSNAATSPSTRSILDAVTKTALLARLPSKCFGYSLFQYSSFVKTIANHVSNYCSLHIMSSSYPLSFCQGFYNCDQSILLQVRK
ncbi:hypothetical protein POM88_054381 [Heracleum sosnowskyi]|uniref:Uncharacterized protein n=1 Tax=Heracleum sosnowskyi TaxID=360622 RepID=A0AAD8LWY6_9APIA|nr:hypothetical protein POM88_054381 [Heracleum sosnowskyi]